MFRVSFIAAACLWAALLLQSANPAAGAASKVGVGVGVGIGRRRRTRDADLAQLQKLEKEMQAKGITPAPELLEMQELLGNVLGENEEQTSGKAEEEASDKEEASSEETSSTEENADAEVDADGASNVELADHIEQPSNRIVRRERKTAHAKKAPASASALEVGAKKQEEHKAKKAVARAMGGESMEADFALRKQQQAEHHKMLVDKVASSKESMEASFESRKTSHATQSATKASEKPAEKLESPHDAPRSQASTVVASAVQVVDHASENATSAVHQAFKAGLDEHAALLAEAEELSSGLQITTQRQLPPPEAAVAAVAKAEAEMQQFMMIKSESVRAACFLKCLEHNPLSGKLYIATCHRGPNQKWKLKGEALVYEYDTQGGRVCKDYQDWRKSSPGTSYQLNLPGKPFGFIAASWEDCRATCFALPMCKQVVFRKATRSCELFKGKLNTDQDGVGGQNVEYVSAHCEEGTGQPKCLENNAVLNAVTMTDCNGKANQKWYFENHQLMSRADNKCLSLKNPTVFGRPSNAAANEVSVTEHCDNSDSNQRWHWA